MNQQKILFIDRDGTLIEEPNDKQIDSLEKLKLEFGVIPALLKLQAAGFAFVMVSNQDGLGSESFPYASFTVPQNKLLELLSSQNINFTDIKICPHFVHENCTCRKPQLGLVLDYLRDRSFDANNSYVIGDRQTDLELADRMGIKGILYGKENTWEKIAKDLTMKTRCAQWQRRTKETNVEVCVNLDHVDPIKIKTGIGFFDHMLEQLAKHGGFSLQLQAQGDLHCDEHHIVEDSALTLGMVLRQALGDKLGIVRYGFLLPMDESLAQIAIDLSGRALLIFNSDFRREKVGDLPTELVAHFFRSFAESLRATINIKVEGNNDHHMIESIFKGVGRALRQAFQRQGYDLPTTKGTL